MENKNCCKNKQKPNEHKDDSNSCIALGAGVGALGIGTAIATGAVCPLCYIVAPALIGAGVYTKIKRKKQKK